MKILMSSPSLVCPIDLNVKLKEPNLCALNGFLVGMCENLKALPANTAPCFRTRTNEILYNAILPLHKLIQDLKEYFGEENLALIIGTTTTGVEENYQGLKKQGLQGYDNRRESLANPALFLSEFLQFKSLTFGVSNACTSGAKAIIEGARFIRAGICKVAIVGGVDSINTLTLEGFKSLGILSDKPSRAFCENREGINIGEAAGLFVLISEKDLNQCKSDIKSEFKVELAGFASNTDAFHITQPSPDLHIKKSLLDSVEFENLDYISAHGTGTKDNDKVEAEFISSFLPHILASSIKPFIGHNLAACGAVEAGLCVKLIMQSLKNGEANLPPQIYENIDKNFSKDLNLVPFGEKKSVESALSLSFAFGGDNVLLYLKADNEY